MKCLSCQTEINPQWKHAIDINVCPYCGKMILEEHLKNLLSTLRETMEQMQQYPDQLNDWMLSNYNYIKTDGDLTPYLPKELAAKKESKTIISVETENGTQQVEVEKIQSEEKTNDFFRRAEAIKKTNPQSISEKTRKLKEMAEQIKKAGSTGVSDDGEELFISAEMMDNADPQAVAEYQSMSEGSEIMSAFGGSDDDGVPKHILQANMAIARGKENANATAHNDLLKLKQRMERSNNPNSDNFSGGGSFSRG
jgi:Zn-finger nucleic acid-binding protein